MVKNYQLKIPTVDIFSNKKIRVMWAVVDIEGIPKYFDIVIDRTMEVICIMDIILDQSISYIIYEEYDVLVPGFEKYKNEWLNKNVLEIFLLNNEKELNVFQKMIEDTLK